MGIDKAQQMASNGDRKNFAMSDEIEIWLSKIWNVYIIKHLTVF
jgi:hypothetical protein